MTDQKHSPAADIEAALADATAASARADAALAANAGNPKGLAAALAGPVSDLEASACASLAAIHNHIDAQLEAARQAQLDREQAEREWERELNS